MKKAFSMIELLFVMVIMGMLASIALPNYAQNLEFKMQAALESNLKSNYDLTQRIRENEGILTPQIDFTSTKTDKTYIVSVDDMDYNYNLSFADFHFIQVKIYDPATEDENGENGKYAGTGIIMESEYFEDCYVFNDITDSEAYKSSDCTPESLEWDTP